MSCGEAPAQHAATIPPANRDQTRPCKFCEQAVIWGLTKNGRAAPFDPDTLRNHWITCPNQGDARKAFPKRKEQPVTTQGQDD